jgi:hypothetical protein
MGPGIRSAFRVPITVATSLVSSRIGNQNPIAQSRCRTASAPVTPVVNPAIAIMT